eukprot:jgi/Botrbrau1/23577/Bobra.0141s0041.1
MSRHTRSGSRARAPSPASAKPDPALELHDEDDVDLSAVDPALMIRHLVDIGALPEGAVGAGSGVPLLAPTPTTTQNIIDGLERVIQLALAQPAPVVVTQPVPTVVQASATASSGSGRPSLKFPNPAMFEGDPMKLDPWIMQTEMYLRARCRSEVCSFCQSGNNVSEGKGS